MRIGVDARELSGHATGVGRYLQCLLREWGLSGAPHHWTLYSPDGRLAVAAGPAGRSRPGARSRQHASGSRAHWPRAVRRDRPDVFFAPGYTAPLTTGVPLVVAMHDVSFAAHPEWYRWREGLRRRWLARLAARQARAVITISEFSRGEIVRHLGITADRVRVIPLGVGLSGAAAPAAAREPLVLFVGSIFNRRHLPALRRRLLASRPAASGRPARDRRRQPHAPPRRPARPGRRRRARPHPDSRLGGRRRAAVAVRASRRRLHSCRNTKASA